MTRNNNYSYLKKLILIGFLFLVFLILGLAVHLNYYWKPIVTERIKLAVNTSTDGLYRIDFDDVRVNFISGNLQIKNIRFAPDTFVYNLKKITGDAPRHLYSVAINELSLKRVQPWKIYLNRALEIKSVEINQANLEMKFIVLPDKRKDTVENSATAFERLAPFLSSIKVGNIIFNNASFKYNDTSIKENKTSVLRGLYIKIDDLLIDSASQFDKSRLYYTKDIYAELLGHHSISIDKNYTVQLKEFRASTAGAYARLSGLSIIPRFAEMEFSKRFNFQKDRIAMDLEDLQLNDVDFDLLNSERRLSASSLVLNKANFSIFLNRELPDSIRNKGFNFPQLALQRFKLNTKIDTLILNDSRVDYSEYNPASRRKGTLTFSQINGQFLNITNDSLSLVKNRFTDLKLTSLLMDRGRLDLAMRFNLIDPKASFNYSGILGNMDAAILNSAIKPLSLIEINSGFIEKLVFYGHGSLNGVRGQLSCYYKDLKIKLLEVNDQTSGLRRKGIASIFANILIIKNDNPLPGAPVRSANFRFNRPQHSSFFNMIWKGFAEALLETIGFDSPTQREIKVRLQKIEAERIERDKRKEIRLKRRDIRRNNRLESSEF
jgi:hypothetical protein